MDNREKKERKRSPVLVVLLAVVFLACMTVLSLVINKGSQFVSPPFSSESGNPGVNTETELNPEYQLEPGGEDETAVPEVSSEEKVTEVVWDESWQYASNSVLHTDSVTLYRASGNRRSITVAVNAGHGTKGGSSVKTLCHPDGTPKVTGGSTAKGETSAPAVSEGTTLQDGMPEKTATLNLALTVKENLLKAGYDVLMIREDEDVQLDNIARTVFANNCADCHISLHYDSTDNDKGLFYISVPDEPSYRSMEPVASHWQEHQALGEAILSGMRSRGVPVYSGGSMALDLTQTSYSTVPSIDLEVGDRASDHSPETLQKIAEGLLEGLEEYFGRS